MAERDLVQLITWLRADHHPCYALLPRQIYAEKAAEWNLPAPELLTAASINSKKVAPSFACPKG